MRRLATFITLALSATLLASAPARSETIGTLPIYVRDMTMAPSIDRMFITDNSTIDVIDPEGQVVGTNYLPFHTGTTRMMLARDGRSVLLPVGGDIVRVDDTGTKTTVSTGMCPWNAAEGGALLWFADCSGALSVVDPETGDTQTFPDVPVRRVIADPADPDVLLAIAPVGDTDGRVERIDVSSGSPIVTATSPLLGWVKSDDLAISPDGSEVFATPKGIEDNARITAYAGTDLHYLRGYPYRHGYVTFREDGLVAIMTGAARFFLPHSNKEIGTLSGLFECWGFLGDYVYTTEEDVLGREKVQQSASVKAERLTAKAYPYKKAQVRVTLSTPSSTRTVELSYVPNNGQGKTFLKTVELPKDGHAYTFTVPMKWNGHVYADYAGDANTESATDGTDSPVNVKAQVTDRALKYVRKSGGQYLYRASKTAFIAGRVQPALPGATVYIQFQWRLASGKWAAPGTQELTLDDDGLAAVKLAGQKSYAGHSFRWRFWLPKSFYGGGGPRDDDVTGNSAGAWITCRWMR